MALKSVASMQKLQKSGDDRLIQAKINKQLEVLKQVKKKKKEENLFFSSF